MSRVKIAEKKFFFVFFPEFFRFLSKNFSDFWPKNFKKFSKLPSTCPEEQFVAWNFHLKFWIVLDFPQKPLAWFSKFYLRVQSKNCGKKSSSFLFSFQNFFSNFERKFFRLLAKKLQQFFKNYLLRVQRNNLWLEFFFVKFWTVSDFLQKLLAWFSKFYLRVQSKNCGKKVFFCFLSRILSTFEQKFFRLLAKKLQKVFKTTFCPSRGTFCDFNFFVKVLNLFGFSAETWYGSQKFI